MKQKPLATMHQPKPVDLVSWWLVDQSRGDESAWFARAAQEVDRMCGSREFRTLGYRKAVEEFGSPMRGPASS